MTERLDRARRYGFVATEVPRPAFTAKPDSHDDGPEHGMFHGGLGGPAFSRDLTGRFSRWHLQPGSHVVADVDAAFLAVRWSTPDGACFARLRRDDARSHEVVALHPMCHEVFTFDGAPFEVTLTVFSPTMPGDEELAGLPVTVFDVHVEPVGGEPLPAVDVLMCWPNLNGWRASTVTTVARGDQAWPGHHHAGNVNTAVDGGVVQSRALVDSSPQDVCGDVALTVGGDADSYGRQVQFLLHPLPTGVPAEEQRYTVDGVVAAFEESGRLGVTPDGSWQAHWHEPVGSAVSAHADAGRSTLHVRYALAFDWPTVRFGAGRTWRRTYAGSAVGLATRAQRDADDWLRRLDGWHDTVLGDLGGWPDSVAGCVVNELNLATSLGTAWVRDDAGEHLGVLEGYDDGYFYYDTADLWHYAFPALTLGWPRLAGLVFTDLGATLEAEDTGTRPVYRPAEPRQRLRAWRMPHDLGSAAEDPFVRVNGYVMRDDPNTWRDLNPAYVLATLAYHRLAGRDPGDDVWQRLRRAVSETTAVPRHDEFGDSTWDNLGLRGYSTYATALHAGTWAVLGDQDRLTAARGVLDQLWTGSHFRAASEGKYVDAVMPDSLMGLFYADVCGAPEVVPRERIVTHLTTAYEYAFARYADGGVGPLLVAERDLRRYERDGGQELQVNEVILGSAWLFVAMLGHYGLREHAAAVAGALRDTLYGGTGLQFRTPAAVDAEGRFRAPLNMRPLAAWWLPAIARLS